MNEFTFPKTPAQAYREASNEATVYNAGVALRIIWEVTKPLVKWSLIVAALCFVGFLYLVYQLVLGTAKR